MADPQGEVVIKAADGTEHVFPAGFDPKKAAAIVDRQSQQAVIAGMPRAQAGVRDETGAPVQQEGLVSRVMGRMAKGYQDAVDTPGVQTGAILAGGLSAAGPKTIGEVPAAVGRVASTMGRGAMRAGGAVADTVSPDVLGVISPRAAHVLRVVQKMRDASAKPQASPGAAPRLAGKAPTLTDSLTGILNELRTEAVAPTEGTVGPGAAPGGSAAADLTMRQLADQPKLDSRISGLPPARPLPGQGPLRTAEVQNYRGRPGVVPPEAPVPLNVAMQTVQDAAPLAKLKLTATETQAAMNLIREGRDPHAVMDAIAVQRALKASPSFANLPSDAEVESDVVARNATGRWGAGPAVRITPGGNPFR